MKIQATFVLLTCFVAVTLGEDDARGGNEVDGGLIVPGGKPDDDLGHSAHQHESTTSSPKTQHGRKHHHFKPCCNMPRIINEEIMSAATECFKDMFQNRTKGPHRRAHNGTRCWPRPTGCLAECIYKKCSLLTAENKVDYQKVQKIVSDILAKKEAGPWQAIAENALKTCQESAEKIPAEQKCQSGAQELSWCFYKQMLLHCPDEQWRKESKWCTAWKERQMNGGTKRDYKKFPECPASATTEAPAAQ